LTVDIVSLVNAKNDFEWLKFLIDIDYLLENKIELIGESD